MARALHAQPSLDRAFDLTLLPDCLFGDLRPGAEGADEGDGDRVQRDAVAAEQEDIGPCRRAAGRAAGDHECRAVGDGKEGVNCEVQLGDPLVPVGREKADGRAVTRVDDSDQVLQAAGVVSELVSLDDGQVDEHIRVIDWLRYIRNEGAPWRWQAPRVPRAPLPGPALTRRPTLQPA